VSIGKPKADMKHTGAEIIIKMLEIHGIERIAGIPGGANLPMYHALGSSKIRHILARHEQGAGFIAQGQARSTGETAVFFATSGPGVTNALTAIADAKLDSVPVICISGQVPSHLIGTDAFQEIDAYGLSVPITKHNFLVRDAQELLEILPLAFKIAKEGRPGPVLIDVPKDVQNQSIEFDSWPQPLPFEVARDPDTRSLEAMAALINESERPMIYLGGGAVHSGAQAEILELLERTGALATSTLMGLGVVPDGHPANLGMLGMHGSRSTNRLLAECDTLIALGVRFDDRATGKVAAFCPQAKVVHIDIDGSEISKIRKPDACVIGDLSRVLDQLLPLIQTRHHPEWMAAKTRAEQAYPDDYSPGESVFDAYGVLDHCAKACLQAPFVTTDVGQHQMRVAQHFPFTRPRQLLTSGGLGTMGFGLPAAIGVALEHPEETVLCVTGDGSLLMNIQELAVVAEENLNIKVIVCNNQALGLVFQQQKLFYGQRYQASQFAGSADFAALARAFGMPGYDLSGESDPAALLRDAIRRKGPALMNIPIGVDADVFPMVPPGGSNTEALISGPESECEEVFA
jgi:acetolactate synthase-1/2/3 large subunit